MAKQASVPGASFGAVFNPWAPKPWMSPFGQAAQPPGSRPGVGAPTPMPTPTVGPTGAPMAPAPSLGLPPPMHAPGGAGGKTAAVAPGLQAPGGVQGPAPAAGDRGGTTYRASSGTAQAAPQIQRPTGPGRRG